MSKIIDDYYGAVGNYDDLLLKAVSKDPTEVRSVLETTEKVMKDYARRITYTQIRNVLQEVKKDNFDTDLGSFYRAIPKLAYMEGRLPKNDNGRPLLSFIRELAGTVKQGQYKSFKELMNTIVAYHKLHG